MRHITAIIRSIKLEDVVKALKGIGVKGITISEVKGRGEEIILYHPYSVHNKIEIIVPEGEVDKIVERISDIAKTGERGDGIICVNRVDKLIKIRTGERVGPGEL
jgi:nitrogen regulatory protein PII